MRIPRILEDFLGHVEAHPLRALYFFSWVGMAIAQNFLMVTLRHEGFSGKEMATVATMGPLLGFFAQPLWGMVADRFGRRRCMRLAILVWAAVYCRLYWVHGYWPLLLTIGALALAPPLQSLMDSVVLDFVEATGKLSYGMFRIWGAIAAGAGTAGAGFLIGARSTRTAFLWATGAFLVAWIFSRADRSIEPKPPVAEIPAKSVKEAGDSPPLPFLWTVRLALRRPYNFLVMAMGPTIRNVPLMTFLVIVLFVAISSTAFWNFNGVYFTDIGASSSLFGLSIAIDSIGEIPFYFLSYWIIKRVGLQRAILLTFICSTIRVFAYAFIGNPHIAVWVELCNGLSWTLFWVAAVEHVNQLVKPEWRATGQTLLNATCWGAGTVLGVLWNGLLLDYFKFHWMNVWVPLAIQKVCFVSGCMLAALTVVTALVFKVSQQKVSPAACASADVNEEAA